MEFCYLHMFTRFVFQNLPLCVSENSSIGEVSGLNSMNLSKFNLAGDSASFLVPFSDFFISFCCALINTINTGDVVGFP